MMNTDHALRRRPRRNAEPLYAPFRPGILLFSWVFALILCTITIPQQATAQPSDSPAGHKVTGTVSDNTGEPLPGATIQLLGSTRGVLADTDGKYVFDNVPEGSTLIVTFLGMQDKEVPYKGEKVLNIVLEPKRDLIDEVTVVPSPNRKKRASSPPSRPSTRPS